MEVERPIVGRWRDVVLVFGVKLVAIGRANQVYVVGNILPVDPLGFAWQAIERRRVQDLEPKAIRCFMEARQLALREGRFLQEEGGDAIVTDDREARGRINTARFAGGLCE